MSSLHCSGCVWVFGDNIETDMLAPGRYLALPIEECAKHCLEALDPAFPANVRPGDLLVAGRNFGCGSSREAAPAALKQLGIGAVVATSFGRIFFRNAIALGLPVLAAADISHHFRTGQTAEVDLRAATVRHGESNTVFRAEPLSAEMLAVIEAGGVFPVLQRLARENQ
jgi:3-isopropylmalate/(R)-2-methylmalate dehydratase small subunit